ncbi:alpha/beta fold hydrolase [Streptomyces sp. NBC_00249]|uniref:alpha/beta hydrolase n=1 Tax=Streptomyces sp. NBC_00249 TaxID=2975690 RepID=UPI00225A4286|nr:alpha/beta hydrolase [Streptomyces sp. NBC_00249]MCX5195477.1 alpha/beta fold hydrolase [Streptomyces sp. NBC_00249]
MPHAARRTVRRPVRTALLAAASLLAVPVLAACGGEEAGKKADAKPSGSPATSAPAVPAVLPAALTSQKPDWRPCPAPSAAQGGGKAPGTGWECATMKAPLDYTAPGGESLDVALIRKKATDTAKRLGSLVYNFGGPGASGVQTLPQSAAEYKKLNTVYDLVSFDPRGVGNTAGVTCLDDKTLDEGAGSQNPLDDVKKFTDACKKNSAKLLPHVGTADTARDMDLMRQVLGDRKLNYFGMSYGTELGGVYAHLFPKNVGRTVFDAVVDPTADDVQQGLGQTKGFQQALEHAMKYCRGKYTANCPTGASDAEGNQRISAMLEKLKTKPAPTDGGRKLTSDQALTGIVASLYDEESWEYLVQGLGEVQKLGTGNLLLALSDAYSGRGEDGRYSNSNAAQAAITCADTSRRHTVEEMKAQEPAFRAASPVFGPSTVEGLLGCSEWPVRGATDKPQVGAAGADPILVIGNTGDPATPVEGAKRMSEALGKGVGVNVTVQGEGHGTYGNNSCATKTVDAFLVEGTAPADGTVCK